MGGSRSNLSRRGFPGGVAAGVSHLDDRMRSDRAWEPFLAEQDLIWRRLPTTLTRPRPHLFAQSLEKPT